MRTTALVVGTFLVGVLSGIVAERLEPLRTKEAPGLRFSNIPAPGEDPEEGVVVWELWIKHDPGMSSRVEYRSIGARNDAEGNSSVVVQEYRIRDAADAKAVMTASRRAAASAARTMMQD